MKSQRNKGSRFENYLVKNLNESGINAHRNYASGAGLDKNDIRLNDYDIEIEAKNSNTIQLARDWEQLRRQTLGNNTGVLAIRNPRRSEFEETFIVIELSDFKRLLLTERRETKETPYQTHQIKYWAEKTKEAAKKLIKEIDGQET